MLFFSPQVYETYSFCSSSKMPFNFERMHSQGCKFPERLVFSLTFVMRLDPALVTPGTPENTDWQFLPGVFLLN